ncbi:MAG: PBP1A family penicillin-binding protein [Bryobacteraceae bacterium]|nr:PBP1A family penicillin-binding protein [Bryobacteraceae bacterium]
MAIRLQVPKGALLVRLLLHPVGKALLGTAVALFILGLGVVTYFYVHYAKLIDEKLAVGPFAKTSRIYAAPSVVSVGEQATLQELADYLARCGYSTSRTNTVGWYNLREDAIEIFPGSDSYFDKDEPGVIKIQDGKVNQIISLRDNTERTRYSLEPELITNLFDKNRQKRRIVKFDDLPKHLVDAVTSVEDKRFFEHAGFDPLRILKAVYVDVSTGRKAAGASTLTMQLARGLWLTLEKSYTRKAAETLITIHLEQKLTKEQIFEYYANYVPLGRRGSFDIHGFGEAAQAYFGKDVKHLTLEESATLAGVIQLPSYRNPIRWPDRAQARRNVVLTLMRENNKITDAQLNEAKAAPMVVSRGSSETNDAPYFVDLVNDTLQDKFGDRDFQDGAYRLYTTLDLDLQRDAAEAVRVGMAEVDKAVERMYKGKPKVPEAQVAMVVLDAQTAEVRALIGGRNYGLSQLNRSLAKRQPGSVFKPFVYAAALNTGLYDAPEVFTTMSVLDDEPTSFTFNGTTYEPSNYKDHFYGSVTMRQALARSLNIPTIKLAQSVGYWRVVDIAKRAGLTEQRATPSVALGSYEATPIDMAGAYTIFPNNGAYTKPVWIHTIRDAESHTIYTAKPEKRQVLDPRVNYLMVNMLEDVMRWGTGAGARSRGFWQVAAGKTGSSRDGWFAGFTSKLICVVWVGFDDNTDIKLDGARSALPVWTEFMKRAHQRRAYKQLHGFAAPEGIVGVDVESSSGKLGLAGTSGVRSEVFIAGTEPIEQSSGGTQAAAWDTDPAPEKPAQSADAPAPRPRHVASRVVTVQKPNEKTEKTSSQPAAGEAAPRSGFWGRVRSIFK